MSGELIVNQLGKSYRVWGSNFRRFASWFIPSIKPIEEHWVLKDINFTIKPGETVGVLGQNGAGKSTLLKLITGTIQPSTGHVQRIGKIAAILELGMGFSPDLTGRQNAYHSAGLMGYSKQDIDKAMSEIEAFAEIGDYFDEPTRTYSSGMQMRVAFSVATAFKPDLLIVDEALSVGDSYFQHKSFDKMRQFRNDGVSIMLVTHSMADILAICDRAILLDKGQAVKDGLPDEVVDYYNALIAQKENTIPNIQQHRNIQGWVTTKSGTGEASVKYIRLIDLNSNSDIVVAQVGQPLELKLKVSINADIPQLILGYLIRDKQGHIIWGSNTWHTNQTQKNLKSGEIITFNLPFTCTLGPGSYSISSALSSSETHLTNNYEWTDNLFIFDVINVDRKHFIGSNYLNAEFSISRQIEGYG